MNFNPISYCTILTFVLLIKFDLLTCVEIVKSQQSTYTAVPASHSSHYTSSSVANSGTDDSWQDPNDVLITRSSSDPSQTFTASKLSEDLSYSEPEHIILSSLPSETVPGPETSQTVTLSEDPGAVPVSEASETGTVSGDSVTGTAGEPADPKAASETSQTGGVTGTSEVPPSQTTVKLLIIDVDNKKSTNEVEYKKDHNNDFDIFTAKDGYFIYSVKKRGDRLWKSRNKNYPIGIAYKERTNEKPLLRVFQKGEDPFASGDSTSDQKQPGSSSENEDEMEVIEVRKPRLAPGSPTNASNYAHKEVDPGYTSDSEDEGTTDDEMTSLFSNLPDTDGCKPKYRPSQGPSPVASGIMSVVEAGPIPKQTGNGTESMSNENAINLAELNSQISKFVAGLDNSSSSVSTGTSAQATVAPGPSSSKSTIEVEDFGATDPDYMRIEDNEGFPRKTAESPDSYGFLQGYFDIQMVEFYNPERDSSRSPRISHVSAPVAVQSTPYGSDRDTIESLYGKGVKYEKAHLGSAGTEAAPYPLEDDDIVIIDPRPGPAPMYFAPPPVISHDVITVFGLPALWPPLPLPTTILPPIPAPTFIPPPQVPRIDTISYDPLILNDHLLSEPAVNQGIYAQTMISIPRHEYSQLRGFPGPRRRVQEVLRRHTTTLEQRARLLKIYTVEEDGTIYENDTTKYQLTKGSDMYTFTFYSSAKCFMIKYKDKEWIHNPNNTLVSYPDKILLTRDKIRVEFRPLNTLQPQA